eukprot:COSAG02_NODE_1491_length_12358_cov_52.348014_12_plen_103_part_00
MRVTPILIFESGTAYTLRVDLRGTHPLCRFRDAGASRHVDAWGLPRPRMRRTCVLRTGAPGGSTARRYARVARTYRVQSAPGGRRHVSKPGRNLPASSLMRP